MEACTSRSSGADRVSPSEIRVGTVLLTLSRGMHFLFRVRLRRSSLGRMNNVKVKQGMCLKEMGALVY